MSADESRSELRRGRPVEKKILHAGPARDLRDAVYRLYAEADRPQLTELAKQIAADDDLPGSPGKDLIGKIISGDGLASGQNTVTVAVALARAAGRERIAQLAEQVRRLWIAAATTEQPAPPSADRLGRPVGECDPLMLEVHPAIHVPGSQSASVLPPYVLRIHDTRLREIVDGMLDDKRSRLVTLVGGSSTGKTRGGWELARYLDSKQPGRWRLWHPYDPTRPQAALAELEKAGPGTIIWLNEAQNYLMPPDPVLAEQVAAGLRTVLADSGRGPVLVLATLWPDYWTALTTHPPAGDPDLYAQARDLLIGSAVTLPDVFTAAEIAGLGGPGIDARLRYAADHAENGRITQYLAGAHEVEERFRTALDTTPGVRALLQVAIDARRLGFPVALPHALLEQAAPGYLDDHDWDALGDDWLESALAYTAQPCKGARGLLTRIRVRPGEPSLSGGQPCYRLADYLEQLGGTERGGVFPPDSLWRTFITTVTDSGLLRTLGRQAELRGRYQHAIWLYRQAADRGDTDALLELARMRERAGDSAGAQALAVKVADRGNTRALQFLASMRQAAGDSAGAEALAVQAADRGDTYALLELARMRERAGNSAAAQALYQQAASHGDAYAPLELARMRERVGNSAGAQALYQQAADRGNTRALLELARKRERGGDSAGAQALYRQAADTEDTSAFLASPHVGVGRGQRWRAHPGRAGRRPRRYEGAAVPGPATRGGQRQRRSAEPVPAGRRPRGHLRAAGTGQDAGVGRGQRRCAGPVPAGRRHGEYQRAVVAGQDV
jgi:hypothetical protein